MQDKSLENKGILPLKPDALRQSSTAAALVREDG
jgi:hypothetical protein